MGSYLRFHTSRVSNHRVLRALVGFVWFPLVQRAPGRNFHGRRGSPSLGERADRRRNIKQEVLLFFVGGVFVIEALSVILQVGSFKLRGKRIFRMAPIHHHFELMGWSESKVIVRFWIAALVFALFALTTLKLR
jgi:phospho-N-acetylmuramoyl-pentapeptide-transferase